MKRSILLFICLLMTLQNVSAQTWTGTTSTNWNVATNWSTGMVPIGADNVNIPASVVSNNWPVFSSNVTINSINMMSGSQLNVNGFMLTLNCVNVDSYFTGASINNTNGASDIVININAGAAGYRQYFRSNTVNDHIIFNLSGGPDAFYEGDVAPANLFNGNVTYNINGTQSVYISTVSASQFNGNLTVTRTIAGNTSMFTNAAIITGNFSYTNNVGGPTLIGNLAGKTGITGTINIDCNNPSAATFEMYNISNQITGGVINVQNSTSMNVQKDTLKVTSLSITGYRGNADAHFYKNAVIGNVTLADDASYTGGYVTYIRNNVITGNTDFSNLGTNVFYDGDIVGTGNIYNGNVTYHGGGSGSLYIAQGSALLCTGNLTIHRTSGGLTQAFNSGSTIGGNFAYDNNTFGNIILGNISFKTSIGGTLTINASNMTSSSFQIYRLINQTTGGNIIVQNSLAFDVQKDTLKLTAFIIAEYTGSNYSYFYNNSVTGNVTFSSAASYSNGYSTSLQNNLITGTSIFTNNGTNAFYEAGSALTGNHFIGNTTFSISSAGLLTVSHDAKSQFDGNLTVNRTVAGTTYVFNAGGTVNGDFSYSNYSAGDTYLGNALIKTSISGTVNITANYTTPNKFEMHRLINQTGGGSIDVQNSLAFNVQRDTLKLSSLSITGYKGNAHGYFYYNSITGNVTLSSAASFSNGYFTSLQNNLITGNCIFTNNGTDAFYEAANAQASNHFIGNTTFNVDSTGLLTVSHVAKSQFDGNLTVNRTVAGTTYVFKAGGTVNGNFSYTNNSGGNTYFGDPLAKTIISGTVNITTNYTTPNIFEMHRLINQTGGGSIDVQNSLGFNVQRDTLIVNTLSLTGYRGNSYAYLSRNAITGNITIADDVSNSNGYLTYIRSNTITGTSNFFINGSNNFFDADGGDGTGGNIYNGNVSYTSNGGGSVLVAHAAPLLCTGSVTFIRSVAGTTYIFNAGSTVNGNFAYTNNSAGNTYLGNALIKTSISGTVNISANYTTPNIFEMHRLINQTGGGSIDVQNSLGFNVQRDTLIVNTLSLTGYRGHSYAYLSRNAITGNITIADDVSNSNGYTTYIRSNTITGTSNFFINGSNNFFDADGGDGTGGNIYNGNVSYTSNGGGSVLVAHAAPLLCTGSVTFIRSVAGTTYIFNAGSTVNGNFAYTNNSAGNTYLGNALIKTSISGTVNISANYTTPNIFEMHRLINQTGGGSIDVQNSWGFNVQKDTLIVDNLSLTGYRGNNYSFFHNNAITGNIVTSSDASYSNGYYTTIRDNVITGNSSFTNNGNDAFYDADAGLIGNKYVGNVTYIKTGGSMSVGNAFFNEVSQNLTLNSTGGISIGNIRFNGSSNGIIEQLGTQPIIVSNLIMAKTGNGKITLNDSIIVSISAAFNSGNIYSSAGSNLIFLDNATYTGSSANSHIIGPVTKIGDDPFIFPIGGPITLNTVAISAPAGNTSSFSAHYKNQNPGIDGYDTNLKAGSFGAADISKVAYWDVKRLSGVTNVSLTMGFGTNPYEQYPVLSNLKVAHWNGAQWDDNGNGGTTGTAANGTIVNGMPITSFSPFTLAGMTSTYFYTYGNPGPGPDGTPVKFSGSGGFSPYTTKQLPGGSYSPDSIYLIANASSVGFKLKDSYGVEKDDTTVTAPAAPTAYISANGNGTVNFTGWRHFVYMRDGGNNIMGAIKDNNLTIGSTTMTTYFSSANVATTPNENIYLKRSFKIASQFAPVGTKNVRLYISKTEFTNLQAADPTAFPAGINSLTITKYSGSIEDSLFNPMVGGIATIIPNSAIAIADLGTMYSLEIDVSSFSGFYISGNNSKISICPGSTITLPSNISGSTYQWQIDNGSGFTNLSDGGTYSGTGTSSLTLTNTPSSIYGYQFRCLIDGGMYSQTYTVKINASWQGTVSTDWENPNNWSCGALPDQNTDVIVNGNKPNFPHINSNRSIRAIKLNQGASITITPGFMLSVLN